MGSLARVDERSGFPLCAGMMEERVREGDITPLKWFSREQGTPSCRRMACGNAIPVLQFSWQSAAQGDALREDEGGHEVLNTQIAFSTAELASFCDRWKVTELAAFGSVLRTDFGPDSDVDLLVSFAPDVRWSLFDLVSMQDELQAILGREVDLVEREAVERSENYIRRRNILSNLEVIYAAR
jgi:predicted nucleotidyltransferase